MKKRYFKSFNASKLIFLLFECVDAFFRLYLKTGQEIDIEH